MHIVFFSTSHVFEAEERLSDHGIKKNVDLILQKEQYIKISRKPVTQFYQILNNITIDLLQYLCYI